MFRTITDFEASWKTETEATQKILKALTDASLGQRVTPEGRTLGKLAWHVIQSIPEMLTHAKLPLGYAGTEPPVPARAGELVAAWEQWSKAAVDAVAGNWTDAMLLEDIEMYGEKWTRGLTLSILIVHAVHHRGQMTVLMRQAGLVVPGIYGPAREEWAVYGMPAQE
jgi:uncharacterized damage-inducible protein DinB